MLGLTAYTGYAGKNAELQAWYDGYRFGDADIYNPWSVLSYLSKGGVAQPYWANTSGNLVLAQALHNSDSAEVDQLLHLLEPGANVVQPVDPDIAYGELESNPSAIWSVLYMAGYFTSDNTELPEDPAYPRALRIPNAEVRSALRREVVERTRQIAGNQYRLQTLRRALAGCDVAGVQQELGATHSFKAEK